MISPSSAQRRQLWSTALLVCLAAPQAFAQADPLPSWNDGAAKKAIVAFVQSTTTPGPKFVPTEARVATFDQDGTLWVEHPMYAQVMYCLDRVPALVAKQPALATVEPFKTVMSGDHAAIAKLPTSELEKVLMATLSGMTTEQFTAEVTQWLATAKHPRWKCPYTDLAYQPMLEVLRYLRVNGYKTYIVTGGGQDFVRVYAQQVYGTAVALGALVYIWQPLLSLAVHEDLAAAEGAATERTKFIFVVILALVVAIAIKIVGALLTIAFLIMPAAAARPLAQTPEQMAVYAAVIGMVAVAAGLFMSLSFDTPGGPSIVLVLAGLFAASIFPSVLRRRGR